MTANDMLSLQRPRSRADEPRGTTGAGRPALDAPKPRRWHGRPESGFGAIWLATAVLFLVSPLIAGGSLGRTSLLAMIPFAAILAIAAVGQTLVVQQGGLDLSVPGTMSVAAVIVTAYPDGQDGRLMVAVLLVAAAAVAAGVLNGLLVGWLSITPLVATLGVGALMTGTAQQLSGGIPAGAPDALTRVALDRTLGVPNTALIALVLVAMVSFAVNRTTAGRRFRAAGASAAGARAGGISVGATRVLTYTTASLCYAAAGVMLAGFLRTPGIFVGDAYLLPTIAAVVLGGTALTGGAGSVVASAVGAIFLTQLGQLVLTLGAPTSAQLLISGGIIALSMLLRLGRRRPPRRPAIFGRLRGVPVPGP
jgi:ribose transport system permease protein